MAQEPVVMGILALVLMATMYFFTIRPQNKRQKEIREMRDGLSVGDRIVTIGGLFGKIAKISENSLMVSFGKGNQKLLIEVKKWSVGMVVDKDGNELKDAERKTEETVEEVEDANETVTDVEEKEE